jgi:serine/alanine adding enzyme
VVKLSFVQLSEESRDLWNDCVSANPHAYVYHLREWGDAVCKTYRLWRWYFAVKEDQRIVGVLPVFYIRSMLFGDKIVSVPFCEYGGPLIADFYDESMAEDVLAMLMKKLNGLARKLRVDYVELRQPSGLPSSSVLSAGFSVLQRYVTFRIDLTVGESEVWKNLDGRTRRHVKKAVKIGTEIREINLENLGHYYALYLTTQKSLGSPPHSYAFLRNLHDNFVHNGLLRMLLALYDGKPVAGIMVFCFKGKMYWWNNVLDRRYASLDPTNLLLWHVIRWGIEKGFKVLDLGRTRREDVGVHHFKSGWGGREAGLKDYVSYLDRVKVPDPLQRRYVFLSRFWSLLPRAFAREAGPRVVAGIGL